MKKDIKYYCEIIQNYSVENYAKLLSSPCGVLKYPFITPGAVYISALWDWDSWLTNIAFRQILKDNNIDVLNISDYEKGCILNFLDFNQKGFIPIVLTPSYKNDKNVNLKEKNMHKPCLAQHAAFLIKNENGNAEWIKDKFDSLCEFIDYYYKNSKSKCGLFYWQTDEMIGVDNDPCTFYRPNKSSASIFLNCLMYKELLALSYIAKCLKNEEKSMEYKNKAEKLCAVIKKECWDEKDGFYYNVDINLISLENMKEIGRHQGSPRKWDCIIQRIGVWSGFFALWSGIATEEQADRIFFENFINEKTFKAKYGVRTLSKIEKMYSLHASGDPSCWLGPVWIISNYIVFKGLIKYGYIEAAKEIAEKTIKLIGKDILKSGNMHEYYHPDSGKPIMNEGFQSWNLLVNNMIAWYQKRTVVEEF